MLSNLLLVLGMAFWLGGLGRQEQFFNVTVAQTAASLLALCIGSLIIPTVFHTALIEDKNTNDSQDNKKNQGLVCLPNLRYKRFVTLMTCVVSWNSNHTPFCVCLLSTLPTQNSRRNVQRTKPKSSQKEIFEKGRG